MKGRGSGQLAAAVVGAVALVVVVWPGVFVVGDIVRGLARGASRSGELPVRLSAAVLLNTAGVALLIGVLATVIALPAAWAGRRLPARAFLLYMVPMLMPSYLAYVGWGLLRSPGTWLGDFLMRGPPGVGAGGNWYPVAAGKVFAVGGLVLWAWPLAAVVMAAAFRRLDEGVLDDLRMEAAWWRRGVEVGWISRGAVIGAVGAVGLVMLGSAVPLHVSQMETYAVQVWRALDEAPAGERWRVWAAAWPLVVMAVGVGVVVGLRIEGGEGSEGARGRGGWREWARPGAVMGMVVWGLSVVAPIGLLVANMRGWGSVVRFWKVASGPFWWSAGIAGCVAGVVGVLGGVVWVGLGAAVHPAGRGRRGTDDVEDFRIGRRGSRGGAPSAAEDRGTSPGGGGWGGALLIGACTALLVAGLIPGVLVGSAMARAWGVPGRSWVGDSAGVVVIGHVARFGFVAVLVGWFLARGEPRELREMRVMDAGASVRGWVEAALPPQAGTLLGAALAAGLLSFHEIEATVMLQPPTSAGGGFAWKVLQALHYNREEDLIPAMLIVLGVGLAGAVGVVVLLGIRPRWGRGASE